MVTSFLADSIEVLQVKQAAEARFGSKPKVLPISRNLVCISKWQRTKISVRTR